MFELSLARELGMTLGQLWDTITPAELRIWAAYAQVEAEKRANQPN